MIHQDLYAMLGRLDILIHAAEKEDKNTLHETIMTLKSLRILAQRAVGNLVSALVEFQTTLEKGAVEVQKLQVGQLRIGPTLHSQMMEFSSIYERFVERGASSLVVAHPAGGCAEGQSGELISILEADYCTGTYDC